MTKVILCALLIVLSFEAFAQKNDPGRLLTKQEYLQKSKNQKTAAWILRGSGAALFIPGLIWAATDIDSPGPYFLIVGGTVCILTSVPLFMASKKNKRRAMSMSLNWQQTMQKNNLTKKIIPSLAINMGL